MTISGDAVKIRNGIFSAPQRTYGETFIEPLICEKFGLHKSLDTRYDAVDSQGTKYEIKASQVLLGEESDIDLAERIIAMNSSEIAQRIVSFSEAKTAKYCSNIQNVKRDVFDKLIYVLLFADCIKIFEISSEEIGTISNWSGRHGLYDEPGKSGQFKILPSNIETHLKNWLKCTMSWEEAA